MQTTITVDPNPIAELSVNYCIAKCAPLQIDTLGISAIDWPLANDSVTWEVFNSSGMVADTTGLTIPSWVIWMTMIQFGCLLRHITTVVHI